MAGSLVVYGGLLLAAAGVVSLVKPPRWLGVTSRRRASWIAVAGALVAGLGFGLPAYESRAGRVETRLDEFAPVWQFNEVHAIRVAAPASRVFRAIREVRADDIFLFGTLTWIRRGGRPLPNSILDAAGREPLIDVALRSGFVLLADEAPRELVIGTVVVAPPGTRGSLTPDVFRKSLPPGFALATMNFFLQPDGPNASLLSTETRVFANDASSRRRFAAYWRLIVPGSAIIRRSWLRAIERRANQDVEAPAARARNASLRAPQRGRAGVGPREAWKMLQAARRWPSRHWKM